MTEPFLGYRKGIEIGFHFNCYVMQYGGGQIALIPGFEELRFGPAMYGVRTHAPFFRYMLKTGGGENAIRSLAFVFQFRYPGHGLSLRVYMDQLLNCLRLK